MNKGLLEVYINTQEGKKSTKEVGTRSRRYGMTRDGRFRCPGTIWDPRSISANDGETKKGVGEIFRVRGKRILLVYCLGILLTTCFVEENWNGTTVSHQKKSKRSDVSRDFSSTVHS